MLRGVSRYLIMFLGLAFLTLGSLDVDAQHNDNQVVDSPEYSEADSVYITIFVSFVVDTNGVVMAVKVKEVECDSTLLYKDCDKKIIRQYKKEAKRVVLNSGPWKPAKQDGKKVRIKFILPVRMKVLRTDILK